MYNFGCFEVSMHSLELGTCESSAVLRSSSPNMFMQVMHAMHQLAAWQALSHLRLSSAKHASTVNTAMFYLAQPRHILPSSDGNR